MRGSRNQEITKVPMPMPSSSDAAAESLRFDAENPDVHMYHRVRDRGEDGQPQQPDGVIGIGMTEGG